jgi:hypothetical protein
MSAIYALLPKWLLAILVVALLATSTYLYFEMEIYKIDAKELKADNVILTNNAIVLRSALDTCTKSLKAEADNCITQQKITTETQGYKQQIDKICVKENPDDKTNISDAIKLSNLLSGRFNGVRSTKDN